VIPPCSLTQPTSTFRSSHLLPVVRRDEADEVGGVGDAVQVFEAAGADGEGLEVGELLTQHSRRKCSNFVSLCYNNVLAKC